MVMLSLSCAELVLGCSILELVGVGRLRSFWRPVNLLRIEYNDRAAGLGGSVLLLPAREIGDNGLL